MLIQVITGTTCAGRFSERVAHWVLKRLSARADVDAELVDLREHPLPRFDGISPARTPRDYPSVEAARLGRTIDRADGYIVLAAEYYQGYPAVLKNAMDWTSLVEWRRKPVAYVGWGGIGGAHAVEQLRQVAVEFEMAPLHRTVHILPDVIIAARQLADSRGTTAFAPLDPQLKALLDDLIWWAAAPRTGRRSDDGPPQMVVTEQGRRGRSPVTGARAPQRLSLGRARSPNRRCRAVS